MGQKPASARSRFFFPLIFSLLLTICVPAQAASYLVTILTSDQSGTAPNIDLNLQNPWGLTYSPTGPFWTADQHTGVSTVYNGSGMASPPVVTIPPAAGHLKGVPTGVVFNPTTSFAIGSQHSIFLFVTQDGTISGWSSAFGSKAELVADNSAAGARYTGMELGNNGTQNLLYIANFGEARVDVFDTNFHPVLLSGSFKDPSLPAGYAPFNILRTGTHLLITYGKQNTSKTNALFCAGCGFVDIFDLNGNFTRRFASQGALNAPWGIALAPTGFGIFSGDVLIANLGDGRINAFNTTGVLQGPLLNAAANPISLSGLWAIKFGNGGTAGKKTELFFVSGPTYSHGRLGKITAQ